MGIPGSPMARLGTFTAKDSDLIPGQGTKLLQATWYGQIKKKTTHGFKST